jgi:hypothetical protein
MEGCVCHDIAEFAANVIPSEEKATILSKIRANCAFIIYFALKLID